MNPEPDALHLDRRAALAELVAHLRLERLEHNLFRGGHVDIGSPSVFGGQVLGQALMAAARTVPEHSVHSLHGYFLRAGDKAVPIVYEVDRVRDGASFTMRRVVAVQHGQPIFHLSASFHRHEPGVTHQRAMPEAPPPEGLPDDPLIHQALLAYASDFSLLGVAMRPHGLNFMQPQVQGVSLDHALWFHRPFRFDDWLLYETDSPSAAGARGFCRGSVFTRDGALVASVAQEGLIRVKP
ncbi:MAG: acyl-CoA thioesterase II [Hydrogenophaga sp.]|nr:acyl-CoA thioesterase II [Hydrogenophaga sp.]